MAQKRSEQDNDGPDPSPRRRGRERRRPRGRLPIPPPRRGHSGADWLVGPIACRPFGELKVGSEQRPTELFGGLAVTSGQLACGGVPEAEASRMTPKASRLWCAKRVGYMRWPPGPAGGRTFAPLGADRMTARIARGRPPRLRAPGFLRGNVRRRAVCATGRRSASARPGPPRKHSTTRTRAAAAARGLHRSSVLGHVLGREPRSANRETANPSRARSPDLGRFFIPRDCSIFRCAGPGTSRERRPDGLLCARGHARQPCDIDPAVSDELAGDIARTAEERIQDRTPRPCP